MHCGSKARCFDLLCYAQVRNIVPLLTLLSHIHHYLRRSVSDLAQVLNVTSSQLCAVSSSMDASKETAFFAERLDGSFTSLIQPCRYASYEISSPLRPTTMLFGCPLPDELDGASIGQRAVSKAFEAILGSTAVKHPGFLNDEINKANQQQGNDVKLVKYLFACPHAIFAHVIVHRQHSNWNHYGIRHRKMVVQELSIT